MVLENAADFAKEFEETIPTKYSIVFLSSVPLSQTPSTYWPLPIEDEFDCSCFSILQSSSGSWSGTLVFQKRCSQKSLNGSNNCIYLKRICSEWLCLSPRVYQQLFGQLVFMLQYFNILFGAHIFKTPTSLACVGFTELTVMNQVPKAFTLFSFRTKNNISVKRQSWRPHYPDSWLTVLPRNELYLCSLFYNPSSQVTTCFPDLSDVSEQEVFHASCCQRLKKEPAFSFEGAKPT